MENNSCILIFSYGNTADMRFLFAQAARKKKNALLLKSLSQEGIKKRLKNTTALAVGLSTLHTGAMMIFEGMPLWQAFWLTGITFSTIGYGDISAATVPGQISTLAFGAIGGVAVLANAIGVWQDWRQFNREQLLNGKKAWDLEDHLVILKSPGKNAVTYFNRLMHQFKKSALPFSQTEIALVSSAMPTPLPESLTGNNVAHINYSANDAIAFKNSCIDKASVIAVLAQEDNDPVSDQVTYSTVARARAANPKARIIAEVVNDENRDWIMSAGANNCIRPVRQYPGMMARAALTNGSEQIAEDLFSPHGTECVRAEVPASGKWHELVTTAVSNGLGTLIGYEDENGQLITGVHHNAKVKASALYLLENEGRYKSDKEIAQIYGVQLKEQESVSYQERPLVILGAPKENTDRYLGRLMYQFRKSALPIAQSEVIIASPYLEKPLAEELQDDRIKQSQVTVMDAIKDQQDMKDLGVDKASTIVVMAEDESSPISDDVTFATVARARQLNPNARIIAEVVSDLNRERIMSVGANNVIRPVRQYPGLLSRAILTPNSEKIAEDLFSPHGTECVRIDVPIKGVWHEVISKAVANGVGTPVGFMNDQGELVKNVEHTSTIDTNGLYVLAKEGFVKTAEELEKIFGSDKPKSMLNRLSFGLAG